MPKPPPPPTRRSEPVWLQPYPDVLLEGLLDSAPGPEARYETKEATALAFVAGLQRLPPLQRTALVLRDVLGFSAGESATIVQTSEASVKGALQRARAALAQRPILLKGLTVQQAAASHDTLVVVVVAVLGGATILFPSLALLFRLVLQGRLDHAPEVARTPFAAAGPRIEPPVSSPNEPEQKPAAGAMPEPLEELDGVRSGFQGLRGWP